MQPSQTQNCGRTARPSTSLRVSDHEAKHVSKCELRLSELERSICDHLACMSDHTVIREHERLLNA